MNKLPTSAWIILTSVIIFSSCTRSIEIEGFSSKEWKSDRNGCKNIRQDDAKLILESKDKVLGQTEHAILKLMGRPDKNELYTRQQKFYIYYIDPGPLCDETMSTMDSARYLSIRFNATGVVNEVFIYE